MEVSEKLSNAALKGRRYELTLKLILVSAFVPLLAPLLLIKPLPALDTTLVLTRMAIASWSGGIVSWVSLSTALTGAQSYFLVAVK